MEENVKNLTLVIVLSLFTIGCFSSRTKDQIDNSTDTGIKSLSTERTAVRVDERGGIVELEYVTLEIPEGAIGDEVKISISVVDSPVPIPDKYVQVSDVYQCEPNGMRFNKPIVLEISFDDMSDKPYLLLRLEDERDPDWEVVDSINSNRASARLEIDSFGFFVVVYEVQKAGSKEDAGIQDDPIKDSDVVVILDSGIVDGASVRTVSTGDVQKGEKCSFPVVMTGVMMSGTCVSGGTDAVCPGGIAPMSDCASGLVCCIGTDQCDRFAISFEESEFISSISCVPEDSCPLLSFGGAQFDLSIETGCPSGQVCCPRVSDGGIAFPEGGIPTLEGGVGIPDVDASREW